MWLFVGMLVGCVDLGWLLDCGGCCVEFVGVVVLVVYGFV